MRQSLQIEKIAAALVQAQAEIGGAVKGSDNPFFKSKYADLNSVILEMKPIFAKHGMAVLQHPVSDEHGVGVCTRIQHSSGEFIEEFFTLPLAKNDPQAAGSAITYAKRYALKALGLMPDLDDDAEAAMYRSATFTEEQKAEYIKLMASSDGWGLKKFASDVGNEIMTALFQAAPKGQVSKQKQQCRDLVVEANSDLKRYLGAIGDAIDEGSSSALAEIFGELDETETEFVMAGLTEVQHTQIADLSQE